MWAKFRQYHYLNTSLNASAQCYGVYDGNKAIGFYSVIHFPHASSKKLKRGHRFVVLPDYQGIGIGGQLESFIGKLYTDKGYRFFSTTSAKNVIAKKQKDSRWKCIRYGNTAKTGKIIKTKHRTKVKTATFEYIGR